MLLLSIDWSEDEGEDERKNQYLCSLFATFCFYCLKLSSRHRVERFWVLTVYSKGEREKQQANAASNEIVDGCGLVSEMVVLTEEVGGEARKRQQLNDGNQWSASHCMIEISWKRCS